MWKPCRMRVTVTVAVRPRSLVPTSYTFPCAEMTFVSLYWSPVEVSW